MKIKTPRYRPAGLLVLDDRVRMERRWAVHSCLCEWCGDEIRTGGEYLEPIVPDAVIREKTRMHPGKRLARRFHPFCWERVSQRFGKEES